MSSPGPNPLPKPRTLLGWGVLAAATAFVKEKYTDLSWGDVARAPVQGILNAYNDPQTSGWRKVWNVAIETTKLGAGIALMAGATALATAAAPVVAASVAGGIAIAAGGLVVGGLASHFIIDPLLEKAKLKAESPAVGTERAEVVPTSSYVAMPRDSGQQPPAEEHKADLPPAPTQKLAQSVAMARPKMMV